MSEIAECGQHSQLPALLTSSDVLLRASLYALVLFRWFLLSPSCFTLVLQLFGSSSAFWSWTVCQRSSIQFWIVYTAIDIHWSEVLLNTEGPSVKGVLSVEPELQSERITSGKYSREVIHYGRASKKDSAFTHFDLSFHLSAASCCVPIMSLIESLPDATLMAVFDLVPILEVIRTCSLVSQRFLSVALSCDLWRNRFTSLPQVIYRGYHRKERLLLLEN